jgi:hypothetical protein
MSTSKNGQSPTQKSDNRKPQITAVGIILIVIIALVTGFLLIYNDTRENDGNLNNQQLSDILEEETNNTTSYQGLITAINGNQIEISAKVAENGNIVDKTVTITTTDNTVFREIDITVPPVLLEELEEGEENLREKRIQIIDIQIGDNIIAESIDNIYGKISFQAYEIKVLSLGL